MKGSFNVANIKSQKKRNRTNEEARIRNRAVRSELKTAVRSVQDAAADGDLAATQAKAAHAGKLLDKAVSKGVIHKNQAANRKSGVAKIVNGVS
jgi:small subunit ribosomal protein S20